MPTKLNENCATISTNSQIGCDKRDPFSLASFCGDDEGQASCFVPSQNTIFSGVCGSVVFISKFHE